MRGRQFAAFGEGSIICHPFTTIFNEGYISIGRDTMIGPNVALSAGMVPGQECLTSPVVRIGDRCLIGRGSGIVGHLAVDIGNDVWTGHHVYITDQNHGYENVEVPISQQSQPESPVTIGDASWLGHGTVVLPGARIGRHVGRIPGPSHQKMVDRARLAARLRLKGRSVPRRTSSSCQLQTSRSSPKWGFLRPSSLRRAR